MSMPFKDAAPALWAAGYSVIPIRKGEKRPFLSGWDQFCFAAADAATQEAWLQDFPENNIGLANGPASGVVSMDVDTDDPVFTRILRENLPASPYERVGKKGRAWLYRWTPGLRTFHEDIEGHGRVYELLSQGSQLVLPPSIHPDTKRPYVSNCELASIDKNELPILPVNIQEILRQAFRREGFVIQAAKKGKGGGLRLSDFVSQGGRDTQLTATAGLFARYVVKGERTLVDAMDQVAIWVKMNLQGVDGDSIDPAKGRQKVAEFVLRDATGPRKVLLPSNWDAGLTLDEKDKLGLGILGDDARKLTVDEIIQFVNVEMRRLGSTDNKNDMAEIARMAARKVAVNDMLDPIQEGMIIRYIASATEINIPELKKQIADMRKGEIEGLSHQEIAMAAFKELGMLGDNPLRFDQGQFRQWTGSHWELYEDHKIATYLGTNYSKYPAMRKYNDHQGALKAMRDSDEVRVPLCQAGVAGLNFANGYLSTDGRLLEHDVDYGMTYTLPYSYDAGLSNQCVRFFGFLERCWGHDADYEDKVACLQEAFGLTLFGEATYHQRAFLLHGLPRSGKTQILELLEAIMPPDCVSSIPPEKWGDTFLPAEMAGKLLNIAGEISADKMIDGDMFKQIVDGSECQVQRKNQQPFRTRFKAAQWFAGNHLPKSRDSSEGFTRRFIVFDFNKAYPENDGTEIVKLGKELAREERSAIAAWAVEGYMRLKRRNMLTLPVSSLKRQEQMAETNNSVRLFIATQVGEGTIRLGEAEHKKMASNFTPLFPLFNAYTVFCRRAGTQQVSVNNFKLRLGELQTRFAFKMDTEGRAEVCRWLTLCEAKA